MKQPTSEVIGSGPLYVGTAFMLYFALIASGDDPADQKKKCEADAAIMNTHFLKESSRNTAICSQTEQGYILDIIEP